MTRTSTPAAARRRTPPVAERTRRERFGARVAVRWNWFTDNAMILTIIAINGSASYEHMIGLAEVNGQTGLDIYLTAGIFDLFAAALEVEKRKDRKRGTKSTVPVILQQISILFSVLANYATKSVLNPKVIKAMEIATGIRSNSSWQVTFAVAPPVVLMLAILMMERRYRLDAEKAAAGTGAGTEAGNPPGTVSGNRGGTGTGDPSGTGDGEPDARSVPDAKPAPDGGKAPTGTRGPGAWPAEVDFPRIAEAGPEGYRRKVDAVAAAIAAYPPRNDGRPLTVEALRVLVGIRKGVAGELLRDARLLIANRAVPAGSRGDDWSEWEGISA